jgi:hypothetical protein
MVFDTVKGNKFALIYINQNQSLYKSLTAFILMLFLSSCSMLVKDDSELYGPASPKNRILSPKELTLNSHVSFTKEVQPILSQRCAVCHSCNDAPCQLNFTSIEGIDRGASVEPVYNGTRFLSQKPTRLDIDATTTAQWREKEFTPVLNERRQNEQINLDNSLLYKVLTTKRAHDFVSKGRLPKKYNIGTELIDDESFVHSQTCPDISSYPSFARNNPQWGMPFVLPALSRNEFKTIETWLEQGARVEPIKELPTKIKTQIKKWEIFLNGNTNKQQLMSRYLYEHLFAGHLYFKGISNKHFFTVVRSKTPTGQGIEIINTVRPYNDPGVKQVYYRLKRYTRTIVSKTHMPYALNDKRMKRFTELFLTPNYTVSKLPSYEVELAANPFKTFAVIPSKNRYQFLLDEAQYFVSGFIKGPVCRGSIALSVIDDHFWVLFMDPDNDYVSQDSEFLERSSDNLRLPSEQENNANLWSVWKTYKDTANNYFIEKLKYLNKKFPGDSGFDLKQIWNGDHHNENAALTIYRHYDSASVLKGFVGEIPKTGWVIDYPIFERIHYLLVAGFDVYGKVGHQLSTRLYMDILRAEAELQFLGFIPLEDRVKLHRHWYRGTSETDELIKSLNKLKFVHATKIKYKTKNTKKEFFVKVSKYLQKAQLNHIDYINLCREFPVRCHLGLLSTKTTSAQKALMDLSDISGFRTNVFPNVTFLRIRVDGSVKNDLVYTIIRNKSYLNTTSLMVSKDSRIMDEDTIDIVPGFVGSYPDFFLQVDYDDMKSFVKQYKKIKGEVEYTVLVDKYGVRRNNPDFWLLSDWFYKKYQHDNPLFAGLFDLNRYKNR